MQMIQISQISGNYFKRILRISRLDLFLALLINAIPILWFSILRIISNIFDTIYLTNVDNSEYS